MRDVALQAGVSSTTVSFVLNHRQDMAIPDATRERVLQVAAELGYRRNGIARSLVRGKTQTIGVIVPSVDNTYLGSIAEGIQEVCAAHHYRVLLAHTRHDPVLEAEQVQVLLEHQVEGLICVASSITIAEAECWLAATRQQGVPCVLVGNRAPDDTADCVVTDDRSGAAAAVGHLVGLGHRRIGHLSGGSDASGPQERCEGYRAALAAARIGIDESLIVGGSFVPESAAACMKTLLGLPQPPTAVFAANDYLAAEAIDVARRQGRRVPEDLAVVGFGDVDVARYLHLTTVHQPARELGRRGTERIFHLLEHPESPRQAIVLPTHLIVRDSCGGGRQPRPQSA